MATTIALAGCHRHVNGPTSEIRFVDAVSDADSVKLTVEGKAVVGDVAYGSISDYQQVPSSTYSVDASAQKSGDKVTDLPSLRYTLDQDRKYTGIAVGSISASPKAHLVVFADDPPMIPIPTNQAEVRVIDAYPHLVKLDVTTNNIVAFDDLSLGTRSKPLLLPSGSYVFKAIQDEQWDDPIDGPIPFDLKGGKSYQIVILAQSDPKQPGMILLVDE